jgi:signal transduction histidine kinase/DNA-binding NarL/FixJ family response regulator
MTLIAAVLAIACGVLALICTSLSRQLRFERRRAAERAQVPDAPAGPAEAAFAPPLPPPIAAPSPAQPAPEEPPGDAPASAPAPGSAIVSGRDRTAFLAVLSHEIRTPLNGIIGLAAVLLEHPMGQTERQYVRIIMESGNHLLTLINDILDYTRLNAGRLELVETAFDVRGVIRGAIELLETEAKTKQLSLTVDIADEVPRRAGGDPARLRQILLNLVGNALKFTRTGGVNVAVRRGATEQRGVRIHFAVTDTGIGIAPEAIGKLFAEFSQVDPSISRRFGGSGLGLVICKQLIERMGGTITVESTFGKGSIFRFDILLRARRASDESGATRVEPPAEPRPTATFSVLVAEDNSTNRLVATRMLQRIGHRVDSVADGRQAVAAVQTGSYDVVLMDLMMPEMDGLAATTAIRALSGDVGSIPIVGLTAADSHADENACRAAGMNHFATKPITAARLAEAIATVTVGRVPVDGGGGGGGRTNVVENRTFDPAVLDELVRELGTDVAAEVVRMFIDSAIRDIAVIRDLTGQGASADAARLAHAIATTARSVGLLRVGRAAADLGAGAGTAEQVSLLEGLLHTGIEELRMWRP